MCIHMYIPIWPQAICLAVNSCASECSFVTQLDKRESWNQDACVVKQAIDWTTKRSIDDQGAIDRAIESSIKWSTKRWIERLSDGSGA